MNLIKNNKIYKKGNQYTHFFNSILDEKKFI